MLIRRRMLGWGLLALALAGCELPEVPAPDSEDILVVEAVLRAGARRQAVLLHRTVQGRVVPGEAGASVRVIADDGRVIDYQPASLDACLHGEIDDWADEADATVEARCYITPGDADYFVEPGRTYRLEILTAGGQRAQGQTTVPSAFGFVSPAVEVRTPELRVMCILPSDPFTLVWDTAEGAWAYVVSMRIQGLDRLLGPDVEVPEPLELTSVSVSAADTSLLFPANVGIFQLGELDSRIFQLLRQGLPPGVSTTLAVVATDRNYANAIRGGRFNPSGQVRIPSVVGGATGVFGSIVPLVIESFPAPNAIDPCPGTLPPGADG